MFAIIGLGNPGQKYQRTRHNIGFRVVDALHDNSAVGAQFLEKFGCLYAKEDIQGQTALLIKPQKFMNLSGQTAQPLISFFKIKPQDIIVVHDDLDLPLGRIRIRRSGSSGGHNGVQDLINVFGASDFYRVRIGIGRPQPEDSVDIVSWVLHEFRSEERAIVDEIVQKASNAVAVLISEGLEKAQQIQ